MLDGVFIRRDPHRRDAQRHGRGAGGVRGCSGAPDAGFRQSWPGWRCSCSWPRAARLLPAHRAGGLGRSPPVLAKVGSRRGARTRQPSEAPDRADSRTVGSAPLLYAAQGVQSLRGQRRPLHASSRHMSGHDGSAKITSDPLGARAAISLGAAPDRATIPRRQPRAEARRGAWSVEIAWSERLMSWICSLPSHRYGIVDTGSSSWGSTVRRLKFWIERLQALIGLTEEPVSIFVGACGRRLGLHDCRQVARSA